MDYLKLSHMNSWLNDKFAKWLQGKYGGIKDVTVKRGKVHDFLGMKLDFGREIGACHVPQD